MASTALSVVIAEDMQVQTNFTLKSVILGYSPALYSKYQGKCLKISMLVKMTNQHPVNAYIAIYLFYCYYYLLRQKE